MTEECLKTRECKDTGDSICECKKGQCHVNGEPIWLPNPGRVNCKSLLFFLLIFLSHQVANDQIGPQKILEFQKIIYIENRLRMGKGGHGVCVREEGR